MLFNDLGFLFLFLPLVLFGFFLAPAKLRAWLLIFASFVFYGWSGLEHAAVLAAGMVWVYLLTLSHVMRGGWLRLVIVIIGPAGALVYYKYAAFLEASVRGLLLGDQGIKEFSLFDNVLLPAGISFFTFQLIAFAIDRYRGNIDEQPRFRELALYVSFFPQLVAGPILRFEQVVAPIRRLAEFRPTLSDVYIATAYFIVGIGSKVLLADGISNAMASFSESPAALSASGAAFVTLGYSLQIYFDFYGYSLAAIGLGRLFGFHFPDNFLRPYDSLNPREFWRRWHVTLSYWIRDYLYLPMGGNRHYVRNITIVFAIVGLWHGAGWNFVVWGLYHGGLVGGYHLIRPAWDRLPRLLQWLLNFTLVSLGWSLFLYDFGGAGALLTSLVGLGGEATPGPTGWVIVAAAFAVCFGVNYERLIEKGRSMGCGTAIGFGVVAAVIAVTTLLFIDDSNTFIYFRF
ncbi:MAG: MBOAT family O-acyltransferase [Alphaproteobacteria bacterium]